MLILNLMLLIIMVVDKSSSSVIDDQVPVSSKQNETVSESKINVVSDTPDDNPNPYYPEYNYPTGYRFFDMDIMSHIVAVVTCPVCCCFSLTLVENKKQGLAFQLKLICTGDNCTCHTYFGHQRKSPKTLMSIV